MAHPLKKVKPEAFKREISLDYDTDLIPSREEWKWITSDEPELSQYREQIGKNGSIDEEI
jgi:hypothetical protein